MAFNQGFRSKMKTTGKALMFLTAMFLSVGFITSPERGYARQNGVIELTYGTPYGPDHLFSKTDKKFFAKVERETKGRVKFKPFWGGTVLGGRGDAIDEIVKGVVDIGFISVGQARTGYDIAKASFLFFDGANVKNGSRVFMELLRNCPEIEREYKRLKVLAWSSGIEFQLLSRKPVKGLADMKGMRIKTQGEIIQVLKQLGVEGSTGPITEAYMNIQKGIWDGAFTPYSQLRTMRLAEVTKYVTVFNLYRTPVGSRVMSLSSWNRLPPDIRKVFEANIGWYGLEADADSIREDEAGREFGQTNGVRFFLLPAEDRKRLNELMLKEAAIRAKKLDEKGLPGTRILQETQRLIKSSGK